MTDQEKIAEMQQRIQTLEERVCEQRKVNAALHRTCDKHAAVMKFLYELEKEQRRLARELEDTDSEECFEHFRIAEVLWSVCKYEEEYRSTFGCTELDKLKSKLADIDTIVHGRFLFGKMVKLVRERLRQE